MKNGKRLSSQNDPVNCKKSIIMVKGEFWGKIVSGHLWRPDATHKPERRKYKSVFTKGQD